MIDCSDNRGHQGVLGPPGKQLISYCPGTWDMFHVGHLRLLKRAKDISRQLTVGVNSDETVLQYKGRLPVIPLAERIEIISAVLCVDFIEVCDYPIDVQHLINIGMEALILGSDWESKPLEGLDEAKRLMRVIFLPYTEDVSTSMIRARIEQRGL